LTNRIIKRIAIYTKELGNSRRSGQPLGATKPKSDAHIQTPQEEYNMIKNNIKELEIEIADIKKQLQSDPNNYELLESLQKKQQLKQLCEEDLNAGKEYGNELRLEDEQNKREKAIRKQENDKKREEYRQGVEQRRQQQYEINERALKELPDYVQKLVNNASNYKIAIYNRLISSDMNIFKKNLYDHFCRYLRDAAKKFLSNKKYVGSGEFKIKSQEAINNAIKKVPFNIVNKFIGQFTIITSGKELLQYLQDTNLINEVIPAVLTNIKYFWKKSQDTVSREEYLSKSNITQLITKKIMAIWKANKFKMMDYNLRHNTKYVAFSISLEQLDIIVQYLINNIDIIDQAKKIIK